MKFQSVLLHEALTSELNAADIVDFYLAGHQFDQAFKFLKRDFSPQAYLCMNSGEQILHEFEKRDDLNLWAQVIYLPKKSYFLFKEGDVAKAEELVSKNINVLRQLIVKGHNFLSFFLVQQTHNLARLYFSKRETVPAMKVVNETLRFLYGTKTDSEYFSGLSLVHFRSDYPAEAFSIINSFINQLANESLLMMMRNGNQNAVTVLLKLMFEGLDDISMRFQGAMGDMMITRQIMTLFYTLGRYSDPSGFILKACEIKQSNPGLSAVRLNLINTYVCYFQDCGVDYMAVKNDVMSHAS